MTRRPSWRTVLGAGILVVGVVACGTSSGPSTTTPTSLSSSSVTSPTSQPVTTDLTPGTTTAPVVSPIAPPGDGPFVEGTIEFFDWIVGCAAENGEIAEITYADPPAISSTGDRAARVVAACWEKATAQDWVIPSPFDGSAEANRLLYRLWLDVHECLTANGYPTAAPPSEEAFIEQGSDLWNPYAAMGSGRPLVVTGEGSPSGDSVQLEAQEQCGADPNSLYQKELQDAG